ncbi:ParA family protein, partial [Serratia fonticola]|nr:ParA family protein [Serratia fonticola]
MDSHQTEKVALRAEKMLSALTEQIQLQKEELKENQYFQVYAKADVAKFP